ncbi:MAG: nucleotide exchange factor GrpE [Nanoarchaeota archaeon]|nr:nucleotide exchange factor GrpE [Nanoarchaeota archaeon]
MIKDQSKSPEATPEKKQLEEKDKLLEEEAKKVKDYIEHLQRLQAEFDNYRKRTEQEKYLIIKQANQELIQTLLIVLDSFELAFKSQKEDTEFTKGMKMIFSELYTLLEKEGLRKIECSGEKFNPKFHEVLLQEGSDKEEGIILEELQKGYMLNDRVIRFSKVKTSKGVEK